MTDSERKEFISMLRQLLVMCDFVDQYGDSIDADPYLNAVETVIESLNETRWIPINEKLPDDPEPVLVTILWHEPYDNYEVSIAEYWDNGEGWGDWPGAEIVAWMPLPGPRRKVKTNDEY